MKKFTGIILFVLMQVGAFHYSYGQGGALGIYTTVSEYDGDLSGNKHQFYKFDRSQFGAAISLDQYLNPSLNLMELVSYNRLQYRNDANTQGVDASFGALTLNLKYKFDNGYIFKENSAFAPFIMVGMGATYINSSQFTTTNDAAISNGVIKANANAGVGILFRFNDRVGIEFSNTINLPLYDGWDGVTQGDNDIYLQHRLGLVFGLKKPLDTDNDGITDKKDKCPDTPIGIQVDSYGCPFDKDNDGVADYLDKCPDSAGTKEMNGCADKDNDGVADNVDKCPEVSGLARFEGCPDTDMDGIQDSEDKCPNIKGLDTFKGCPDTDGDGVEDSEDKCSDTPKGVKVDATGCTADTDGDGVIDTEDACPTLAGVATNKGCPEVKAEVKQLFQKALQGIQFQSGKAIIKSTSFPILDAITKVMNDNPSYKLIIGGHTDDSGNDDLNMTLSQNRADAVAAYMIKNGVDPLRISAKGFGETTPIDNNKTAAGRTRNRRVEFKVEFLQ